MASSGYMITSIAVSIYIGAALFQFFHSITRDLITPFIAAIFPNTQQTIDHIVINIGPVKLKIGEAIAATINLLIAYFVVSLTLPYVREYTPVINSRR